MPKLIEEIQKVQQLKGLSDQAFGRALGINPSLWSKIKRGKQSPGGKFLRAVARTYPELRLAVYDYMAGGNGEKDTAHA